MKTYELFEILARATWHTINSSHSNKVLFGEDAITSFNLNAIASVGPLNAVFEDTRVNESVKGCDFELWIGSNNLGWYRYAIQAKKISMSSGSYQKLGYKVGKALQIDILEKYAKANKAVPLYCFYNFSILTVPWGCSLPQEVEQLGCSITPSHVVRTALKKRGGRTFAYIHAQPETLPWRCLVKCSMLVPTAHSAPGPLAPHRFPKLPDSLELLRQQRRQGATLDRGSVFNIGIGLFPRHIAVVDTGEGDNLTQQGQ